MIYLLIDVLCTCMGWGKLTSAWHANMLVGQEEIETCLKTADLSQEATEGSLHSLLQADSRDPSYKLH